MDSFLEYKIAPPEYKFAVTEGLDDSFFPAKSSEKATGWDVRAAEDIVLHPTITKLIPLGVRCVTPAGWWLKLDPRSSTFAKKQISVLYGDIDEDFYGQMFLACQWFPSYHEVGNDLKDYLSQQLFIEKGERIGQLIPFKRQDMDVVKCSNKELDLLIEEKKTNRSIAGFGGSGNK